MSPSPTAAVSLLRRAFYAFLFWLALPAGLLFLAFAVQSGILAICVYALFLLLVVSRIMAALWLRPLVCTRELSTQVIPVGGTLKVFVKLTNPSRWPILWNYVEDTLPKRFLIQGQTKRLIFVPPRRSFHLHYAVTVTRRGCHPIGPLVMETGDVFGLFKKCRIDRRIDFVTAVPPYQAIDYFQVGRERRLGDLVSPRSLFEDSSRLRGVREYHRGDSLKRIHWRASARTGTLFSKIYDPVVEPSATVVLDFHRDSWGDCVVRSKDAHPSEIALTSACSVCRYLADGGWRVGFLTNGRDPLGMPGLTVAQISAADSFHDAQAGARARRHDDRLAPVSIRASSRSEQFPAIHENLGRIELTDGLRIERVLLDEIPHIEREQALIVLTGGATDDFLTAIMRAAELGYRILVFMLCNPAAFDRALDALAPHGVTVFDTREEWRLEEIATGRKSF